MPSEVNASHITYMNSIFSNFISGLASYIGNDLFPRSQDTIIATYSKAVEHVRLRKNNLGENWSPKYPFVVVDPQFDFEPDPQMGMFHHGFPNFSGYLASQLYEPRIYQDDNLFIAPVLNAYRGTVEVTIFHSSINELMDFKFDAFQTFGGLDRPIYPKLFECVMIIPDYIANYEYSNPYTNESYTLDWTSGNNSETILVKNINTNKLCFPCSLRPYITLKSISDVSDKFGGSKDALAEYKINMSLEWYCALPVHFILVANKLPESNIKVEFINSASTRYIANPMTENGYIRVPNDFSYIYHYADSTSGVGHLALCYDEFQNYIITSGDSSSFQNDENITIELVNDIPDERYIAIHSKYGYMKRDVHWKVISDNEIELIGFNLKTIEEDDIVTIIFFKDSEFILEE